jgi:deoxyinosine 3'endonuclease (endonuclease V)
MTTLRERADSIAKSVFKALDTTPTEDQAKTAADVIEKAVIEVVLSERQRCASVVVAHGTPDADRAHKLAEKIHRADAAMVAGRAADTR